MKTTIIQSTVGRMFSAILLAGVLATGTRAQAEDSVALSDVLARHAELLGDLAKAVAAAGQDALGGASKADATGAKTMGLQTTGLRSGSLATSSLQPSTSLASSETGSLATGLTPIEQWRAFFPKK